MMKAGKKPTKAAYNAVEKIRKFIAEIRSYCGKEPSRIAVTRAEFDRLSEFSDQLGSVNKKPDGSITVFGVEVRAND